MTTTPTRKDAEALINLYGFSVFPIHGAIDGVCTCGNPKCTNVGKHPATQNGLKDATKDMDRLVKMYAGRKGLNIAIATGDESRIFVIDIDGPEGEKDLKEHEGLHGALPKTLTVKTARGRHLYFRESGHQIITKTGVIGDKVDVRGEGGYVVAPPSNHKSGAKYEFVEPIVPMADAPEWLLDRVEKRRIKSAKTEHAPSTFLNDKNSFLSDNSWTVDDARDMLSHISPDISYDEWINVGMALHEQGFSLDLWDDWSRAGLKYDGSTGQHWKSFSKGGGVSFGTIVHMAKQGGWEPKLKGFNPTGALMDEAQNTQQAAQTNSNVVPLKKAEESHPNVFPYSSVNDIEPVIDVSDFVEDTLRDGELSVVYGRPNCGKTFFMVDMAMHVATGRSWMGKEVEQGAVAYVSLEGGQGIKNRISAFKKHYHLNDDVPLAVIAEPFSMMDIENGLEPFYNTLKAIEAEYGTIKLIVVDTLARAMAGADENSTKEMSEFIGYCDKIRSATGSHLTLVHHSGKDETRGSRGSSALLGGIDTEIHLTRDEGADFVTCKIEKQREMELGNDFFYRLESVHLGTNRRGKSVQSCVVLPQEFEALSHKKSSKDLEKRLHPNQWVVHEALKNCLVNCGLKRRPFKDGPEILCVTYDQFRDQLKVEGYYEGFSTSQQSKKDLQNQKNSLKTKGLINFANNFIWRVNHEI